MSTDALTWQPKKPSSRLTKKTSRFFWLFDDVFLMFLRSLLKLLFRDPKLFVVILLPREFKVLKPEWNWPSVAWKARILRNNMTRYGDVFIVTCNRKKNKLESRNLDIWRNNVPHVQETCIMGVWKCFTAFRNKLCIVQGAKPNFAGRYFLW